MSASPAAVSPLVLPPARLRREITDGEVTRYRDEGVVHLPGVLDTRWAQLLAVGIDELLKRPTTHTIDFTAVGLLADGAQAANAGAGSALTESDTEWAVAQQLAGGVLRDESVRATPAERGRFISVHQIAWKERPEIRALALDSPCPQIAARLMGASRVNFYQDQVLVKPPLTLERTAWHQDQGYDHCEGEQVCAVRVVCDPESLETGTVKYLRGSHRSGLVYKVNLFVSGQTHDADPGEELPDFDQSEEAFDFVHFEPRPGDVVVHHLRCVHGSGANRSDSQTRRAVTIRYAGDDVVYKRRPFAPPDGIALERVDGRPLDDYPTEHPRVWPRRGTRN